MSRFQKEKLLKNGVSEKKVRIISTPIDIERFDKTTETDARHRFGQNLPWPKVVLMVGRKDPVKDFGTLFNAMRLVFEKVDHVGLWLVGNFTDYNDVPLAKERVALSGVVSTDDVRFCYKLADVVVLSSTSESFGKVLVEANACAKPVVATATSGANEIIEHGENGFISPIKDYKKLADNILYLLNNPEEAKKIGEKGRDMVKSRYMDNTQKVIDYWKDLVD